MRRKLVATLLSLAAAASMAFSVTPAAANHCTNPVNLSSGFYVPEAEPVTDLADQDPAASYPLLHQWPICTVDSAGFHALVDGRIVWPGATHVLPSYNSSVTNSPATLAATLTGMGFTNKSVTLKKWVFEATGGVVYLGGWEKLSSPATAGGSITVTVTVGTTTKSQTFKTPA